MFLLHHSQYNLSLVSQSRSIRNSSLPLINSAASKQAQLKFDFSNKPFCLNLPNPGPLSPPKFPKKPSQSAEDKATKHPQRTSPLSLSPSNNHPAFPPKIPTTYIPRFQDDAAQQLQDRSAEIPLYPGRGGRRCTLPGRKKRGARARDRNNKRARGSCAGISDNLSLWRGAAARVSDQSGMPRARARARKFRAARTYAQAPRKRAWKGERERELTGAQGGLFCFLLFSLPSASREFLGETCKYAHGRAESMYGRMVRVRRIM